MVAWGKSVPPSPFAVLFLCTGNRARSIMAEGLLRAHGGERFRAFSAGSRPRGSVHPGVLSLLAARRLPTAGLRSKGWEEFARPGAPRLDLVVTVCDAAARDPCPLWPGAPLATHWSIRDPDAPTANEVGARIEQAFAMLDRRIRRLAALDPSRLSLADLRRQLDLIVQTNDGD
jgi:arsenate reductase